MTNAKKLKLILKINDARSSVPSSTQNNGEAQKTSDSPQKAQIIPVQSPMHLLVPALCQKREHIPESVKNNDEEHQHIQTVLRQMLPFLDGIQSLCALEVKLKYGDWRIVVVKTARIGHLLRCRVVCDITRGKIRVKLHTSMLAAMVTSLVPAPVQTALAAINAALNCIPVGNSAIISTLSSHILKFIVSEEKTNNIQVSDNTTVEGDPSVTALLDSLLCLNITLRLTRDITINLKRKEWFSYVKKKDVELDVRYGLQSAIKQPRIIFRRKKFSFSIDKLNEWINMENCQSIKQQVLELISHLQLRHIHPSLRKHKEYSEFE